MLSNETLPFLGERIGVERLTIFLEEHIAIVFEAGFICHSSGT